MNNLVRSSLACALSLCWAATAVAEEFDIRNLDLDNYTYPGSKVIDKRQEQTYAKLTLLTQGSAAEVVQFYENMGLKLRTDGKRTEGTPAGRVVFENRMLSEHAPLTVMFDTDGSQGHNLDDHDLYADLEIYVATETKTQSDLDAVRQRFDGLKQRSYGGRPSSLLADCKSSMSDAQEMSMEERGRRMQELAMQGRMDELEEMMEGLIDDTDLSSTDGIAAEKWDAEIECLEKLERESYPIRITVVADRDDLLG